MQNKRKFIRISLDKHVKIKFKGKDHFSKYYTKDISLGGLFIKTTQSLPVGTVFRFEFLIDEQLPPIEGTGKVVRISTNKDGKVDGLGIKFISLNSESLDILTRVIQTP